MNFLICDDASVIRRMHTNVLTEHGIQEENIYHAKDGQEAVAVARDTEIHVFLIDWNMPNMKGVDLARVLRKLDGYEKTPIVMITAEAGRYSVIEAIEAGVTDYIIKPIKSNILWDKISKYIE